MSFVPSVCEITDADNGNGMNPQHFGSDPADTRMNPEIRLRIHDHFFVDILALAEVYAL